MHSCMVFMHSFSLSSKNVVGEIIYLPHQMKELGHHTFAIYVKNCGASACGSHSVKYTKYVFL